MFNQKRNIRKRELVRSEKSCEGKQSWSKTQKLLSLMDDCALRDNKDTLPSLIRMLNSHLHSESDVNKTTLLKGVRQALIDATYNENYIVCRELSRFMCQVYASTNVAYPTHNT
jgi:hypothetical protein